MMIAIRRVWLSGFFLMFVAGAGCSYLFVEGPPPDHAQSVEFECTRTEMTPILDASAAGSWLAGAIYAAFGDEDGDVVGAFAVTAAAYGASAMYGLNRVHECRDARIKLAIRQHAHAETEGVIEAYLQEQGLMLRLDEQDQQPNDVETPGDEGDMPGVQVDSIHVTPGVDTIAVGDTIQLEPTAYDSDGNLVDTVHFIWLPGDLTVVRVNRRGEVVGVATGEARVQAIAHGAQGRARIIVEQR